MEWHYSNETIQIVRIMLVDDDPVSQSLCRAVLKKENCEIKTFEDGESALVAWNDSQFDICILDWRLPNMDGLELCRRIRATPQGKLPFIICITAASDIGNLSMVLDAGGDDFIEKPIWAQPLRVRVQIGKRVLQNRIFAEQTKMQLEKAAANARLMEKVFNNSVEGIIITDKENRIVYVNRQFTKVTGYSPEEVLGKNPSFLSSGLHDKKFYEVFWDILHQKGHWRGEIINRRKNGEIYTEWININKVIDENGVHTHYVALFSDVTESKAHEEKLRYLQTHDLLTDLPNRNFIIEALELAITRNKLTGKKFAVLFLDINRFKLINESIGHKAGDEILLHVSRRLKGNLSPEDILARVGSDEFLLLTEQANEVRDVLHVVEEIFRSFQEPITIMGKEHIITVSIGITLYPNDGSSAAVLLRNAETAMHRSQENANNTYQFFSPDMNVHAFERLSMEVNLRRALKEKEFFVQYQPKFTPDKKTIKGMEALLRWRNRELGIVSPNRFIPLAEETGLIHDIGSYVLLSACQQAMLVHKTFKIDLPVSVNVSAVQFNFKHSTSFIDTVKQVLQESGLQPALLEIELTESLFIQNPQAALEKMEGLKRLGVALSLDDFGTGFSSMSYLRDMPINTIKIDKSFINGLLQSEKNRSIVESIISLAHSLGMMVVAEGVEEKEQLTILTELNCDLIQGYLFSKPLDQQELMDLLKKDCQSL